MKTKQITAYGLIAIIFALARHGRRCLQALGEVFAKQKLLCLITAGTLLVCAACDTGGGGKPEPVVDGVKNQSETINPFEDYKVTVKGTFTNSEWTGVTSKIENGIKGLFEKAATESGIQDILRTRFVKCKTIFVEKTSDYDNWKTTGDGESIYINFNILDANSTYLATKIDLAVLSMEASKTEKA
jgi:hypothetical protein